MRWMTAAVAALAMGLAGCGTQAGPGGEEVISVDSLRQQLAPLAGVETPIEKRGLSVWTLSDTDSDFDDRPATEEWPYTRWCGYERARKEEAQAKAKAAGRPATRPATQPAAGEDETVAQDLRVKFEREDYRAMLWLLRGRLAGWERLAVLERLEGGWFYRFTVLADGPGGCYVATNMDRWHEDDPDPAAKPTCPGIRIRPVRPADARAVFEGFHRTYAGGACELVRGSPASTVAVNVFSRDGEGGAILTRQIVFEDALAWSMIRGYMPLDAAERVRVRPAKAAELDSYRFRRREALVPVRAFWALTHGLPDVKDAGGLEPLLRRVAKIEDVGIRGESGGEFPFQNFSRGLTASLTPAQLRDLLKRPELTVRVMAMHCINEADPAGRLEALTTRLRGRQRVRLALCCVGGEATEGQCAWAMLHSGWPAERTLADRTLLALDVELLADNRTGGYHEEIAAFLAASLHQGRWKLSRAGLAELCPKLPLLQQVKAVGRMKPEPAVRRFLIDTMRDAAGPAEVRLAAASGLTRDVHDEAMAALWGAAEELDKPSYGRGLGGRFVREIQWRRELRKKLAPLAVDPLGARGDDGAGKESDEAIMDRDARVAGAWRALIARTVEMAHPLCLEELYQCGSDGLDVSRKQVDLAVARRLGDFAAPWDTYGETAWRLFDPRTPQQDRKDLAVYEARPETDLFGPASGGQSLFEGSPPSPPATKPAEPDQMAQDRARRAAWQTLHRQVQAAVADHLKKTGDCP